MTPLMAAVFFTALFEAFAQSSVQWAHRYQSTWHFLLALMCYAVVCFFLYVAYNYQGVGIVNALWSGMTIVMMLAIGYFVFEERLTRWEWVGVAFIVTGMLIINVCCSTKPRMHAAA